MNRREFLKKVGRSAALTAAIGETGLLNVGCRPGGHRKAAAKPDFPVSGDPKLPKIILARNENHAQALSSALDGIGGIARFIKKGEKVLIKPNAAWDRVPEQGVNTNPILVGEMVRRCRLAGASDIIVTDYGGRDAHRIFSRSGIEAAVEQNGGRIIFLDEGHFLEDNLNGKFITNWPVLKNIFEVDRLINMPIAKHHGLALGTAAMKNFFGIIGGARDNLHVQLDQAIVDLAAYFNPTLTVIDATRVLMRHGPGGGSLGDVKACDSVICATDQVAADSRASEFLGWSGPEVSHIVLAGRQGLGEIDYRKAGYKEIT
jgi:uncharacterized protein (DUF362 family)